MPRPISAGVFGMARTTQSEPSQAAILSDRMPAATLRCTAFAVWARACCAASLNVWGLTAHTTTPARSSAVPASGRASIPWCARRAARASSQGSTTSMPEAGMPCRISPPMMALAMLPPPMKAIAGCSDAGEGVSGVMRAKGRGRRAAVEEGKARDGRAAAGRGTGW